LQTSVRNVFGLEGKTCVVTGAGSGIGRATALALAADGARVAVLDRNVAGAEETAHLVARAGGEGIAIGCDIGKTDSIEAARLAVHARFGDADVLVNNAGIIRPGGLEDLSLEDWNALIAVNLTGYFLCSQAFGRPMLARGGGALVHVSSIAAVCPTPLTGSYSVGKAGVSMLSQLLAVEWGPRGVRSNAVLPGFVVTALVKTVWDKPGVREQRSRLVPSRRAGEPEDLAQTILFLASERAAYVNGAEILVDGAFSKSLMSSVPRPGFDPVKA